MMRLIFGYRGFGLLCFLASFSLMSVCQTGVSFDPKHQKEITSEFEGYIAKLKIYESSAKQNRLQIEISKEQHILNSFALPDEMAQVDEITFASDKNVIIFGHLAWAVSGIVIYNIPERLTGDYFWCYKPALSKDKRFLVYEKFYPQHFTKGVSSEYLVYDLQKSAQANRPPRIRNSDLENVGFPIYPPGSNNSFGDNVERSAAQVHDMRSEGFYWSNDNRKVAFADKFNGVTNLVVVDISNSADLKVKVEPLPLDQIVSVKGLPGICEGVHRESWFTVSRIDFDDHDPAKLHLSFAAASPKCLQEKQLDMFAAGR